MQRFRQFAVGLANLFRKDGPVVALGYFFRTLRLLFVPRLSRLKYPIKGGLPPVAMVFVVGKLDYQIAKKTITKNIEMSQNPVSKITVISQDSDFSLNLQGHKIEHLVETELIPAQLQELAKENFGERAGWVIQQLLKIYACANSSGPLVIIDTDTEFVKPIIFVDERGFISLPSSPTRNIEYESALKKLGLGRNLLGFSHVIHFLVVDPKLLGDSLRLMKLYPIKECLLTAINLKQDLFSLDYEALSQIMIGNKKTGWRFVKVKNRDAMRSETFTSDEDIDSLSYHHYIQSSNTFLQSTNDDKD